MESKRKKIAVVFVAAVLGVSVLAVPAGATSDTLFIGEDTTLTEDHFGNIVVAANDVTLDCDGHTVQGTGDPDSFGIVIGNQTGVTIKNCHVTGFWVGIQLIFGDNNVLRDNHAEGNTFAGFAFFASSWNTMVGNTAHANGGHGFGISASDWNTIKSNTLTDNGRAGILLFFASNNDVRDNSATGNSNGVTVGFGDHNTLTDNTANENGGGFLIDSADYTVLRDNKADRNTNNGFEFRQVSFNTVVDNQAFDNANYGFRMVGDGTTEGNVFEDNRACQNGLLDAAFDGGSIEVTDNRFCVQ